MLPLSIAPRGPCPSGSPGDGARIEAHHGRRWMSLSAPASHRRIDGISEQTGNCHRTYPAWNRRDRPGDIDGLCECDVTPEVLNKDIWYRDIGGGMGQALNAASAMDAYTLTDRGTWLSFNNKGSLIVAIEGDPRLLNRYDVIELNSQKHAGARLAAAKVFADWLVSSEGQQAIGAYQVSGEKLFNPSAGSPK